MNGRAESRKPYAERGAWPVFILLSALCFLPCLSGAEFLPTAHELFQPLTADPRELQYAIRWVVPVAHKLLGEASVGDSIGLYRWNGSGDRACQLSLGGGAFGRFDLSERTNRMVVSDYVGILPIDFRDGPWSARVMLYHSSSHLGDDVVTTEHVTEKHSWDNFKWVLSYAGLSHLRLYGGYTYVFRTLPRGLKRNALQGGFEARSGWHARQHLQFYWANDFQSWERVQWNPTINSQAGVTLANHPGDNRAVSVFVEYTTGHQTYGQFFLQRESRWNFGIHFRMT